MSKNPEVLTYDWIKTGGRSRELAIYSEQLLPFATHRDRTPELIWITGAIVLKSLMPYRRFHLDVLVPPETVIERIREKVRSEPQRTPRLKESFRKIWKEMDKEGPPFRGKVHDRTFRIQQVVRGRNSFIPWVWGRVDQTPTGARRKVTMLMHPFAFLFMLFWLGTVGRGIWTENSGRALLIIMFTFGAVLSVGGFYWEAAKAERLLSNAVVSSSGGNAAIASINS